jgi:hypothetical protein
MDGLRERQSVRWSFTESVSDYFPASAYGYPRDNVSGDCPGVLMILYIFISSSEKK